jgi:cytosine/uracil/thiamine/allantoin permease
VSKPENLTGIGFFFFFFFASWLIFIFESAANSTETSTSTSGVFQYLNLVIFCAALATGVILFFVGRHVHKSGENMYLLRMCMVLGDYTSDVILTVTTLSRAMETSDNGAFAAGCILLITITLPPILNLL